MKYKSRLSTPSTNDKNWISSSKGGYNQCIVINKNTGSCIPNCVGYVWGRWRELLKKTPKLSKGNAENWWDYNDGYSRGQTPKLGAVACWRKGQAHNSKDGAGHVAIVEAIASDGTVTFSNSAYGGKRFYMTKMKKPYNVGSKYSFQGFIYIPNDYSSNSISNTNKTVTEIAKEVIAGKWGNGADRKSRLTKAGYDYSTIQSKVNELLKVK